MMEWCTAIVVHFCGVLVIIYISGGYMLIWELSRKSSLG